MFFQSMRASGKNVSSNRPRLPAGQRKYATRCGKNKSALQWRGWERGERTVFVWVGMAWTMVLLLL